MEWHRHAGADRPTIASQGTCGRTSLFLQRVLKTQGFSADWVCGRPRSGPLEPEIGPFGFNCGKSWQSHAWVECGDFIVDIKPINSARLRSSLSIARTTATTKATGMGALPEFVLARRRAVDDIWPQWQRISAGGPKGSLTP